MTMTSDILQLHAEGLTNVQIHKRTGYLQSTISAALRRHKLVRNGKPHSPEALLIRTQALANDLRACAADLHKRKAPILKDAGLHMADAACEIEDAIAKLGTIK